MGVYYFLLNDAKRERVHLDWHVKRGPMTLNPAVPYALHAYMLANVGDSMRLFADSAGNDGGDYTDVDLLSYAFDDPCVAPRIVRLLNECAGHETYLAPNGKPPAEDDQSKAGGSPSL